MKRLALLLAAAALVPAAPAPAASLRDRIDAVIRTGIRQHDLHAVIAQVTVRGKTVLSRAYGTSQRGVPANLRMRFRNGGVAISYMSTLLLRLVDQGKVSLDDRVSKWLPNVRGSHRVTLGQLAQMSAGYHDYEQDPKLQRELTVDPFRNTTTQEQLRIATSKDLMFTPGTNWSYAHSDYVILGLALQRITHQPLATAIRNQVLRPLGLRHTVANDGPPIPSPVLHAYTSERRGFFGIPKSKPFIEESTYWDPSWSIAHGAIETTDIADMTRTAIGLGSGKILSPSSYRLMIDPHIGLGKPKKGCERCRTLTRRLGYGLGIFNSGGWLLYNPSFNGYAAIEAYLPSQRVSIAITTTFGTGSFDAKGNATNWSQTLYQQIGRIVAPKNAPPA